MPPSDPSPPLEDDIVAAVRSKKSRSNFTKKLPNSAFLSDFGRFLFVLLY